MGRIAFMFSVNIILRVWRHFECLSINITLILRAEQKRERIVFIFSVNIILRVWRLFECWLRNIELIQRLSTYMEGIVFIFFVNIILRVWRLFKCSLMHITLILRVWQMMAGTAFICFVCILPTVWILSECLLMNIILIQRLSTYMEGIVSIFFVSIILRVWKLFECSLTMSTMISRVRPKLAGTAFNFFVCIIPTVSILSECLLMNITLIPRLSIFMDRIAFIYCANFILRVWIQFECWLMNITLIQRREQSLAGPVFSSSVNILLAVWEQLMSFLGVISLIPDSFRRKGKVYLIISCEWVLREKSFDDTSPDFLTEALFIGRIPIRCSFRSEFLDKEGALRTARTTIHLSCPIKSSAQPIRNSSRRDVVIAFSDSFAIPESEIVAFLLSIVILKPQISVSMWQILLTKFRITPNWNRALRELLVGNPCPVVSIWMTLRRSWIGKGLRRARMTQWNILITKRRREWKKDSEVSQDPDNTNYPARSDSNTTLREM